MGKTKLETELFERSSTEWNHYLSGFIDGEGCFSVSFTLREKMKYGVEIRPSFSIGQSITKDNYLLLEQVKRVLGCGAIRVSKSDRCYKYETRNLTDIRKSIIPFVEAYPLYSSKRNDFLLFAQICSLIANKSHLTPEGIEKVIDLSFSMNESGIRKTTRAKLLETIEKRRTLLFLNH
ncbi:probable LAGLIDADG homing endonuclease (mitochondrion) [Coccomyxa sp. Obi]|nr:probable LAGLIDADG homing endonuclease [Coccomyxa sp. Obi]